MSIRAVGLCWILLLSACEKPTPPVTVPIGSTVSKSNDTADASQTIKALDQNLAAINKITNPADVNFEEVEMDYTPPKRITDSCTNADIAIGGIVSCPTAKIVLAKSTPDFIARVVNESITQDNSSELLKFRRHLDEFFLAQLDDDSSVGYARHIGVERLPNHRSLVQIASNDGVYAGGRHSDAHRRYYLFDMTLQSQIGVKDLVLPGNEQRLVELLQAVYEIKKQQMNEKDSKEHPLSDPLTLTDNLYFDKQGLVFSYQSDELSSLETIELPIAFEQLREVIRPEYL